MGALAPGLGHLVALSAALAAGDAEAVRGEAERAMDAGADGAAVYEALLQSYLFLGFPRAIEGFFAAQPVLTARGALPAQAEASDPKAAEAAGVSLCRRVYGRNYERLIATMRGLSPDLAAWMIQEGYGKTLSRQALDPVSREYCVIAILTVTGMARQLRSHAIGAVNVGGSRAGVKEAIERCRPWAGARGVDEALRVAELSGEHASR